MFIFASSIVFAMASMGLYDPDLRVGPTSIFARTILSFVMAAALMAGLAAAFPDLSPEARQLSVCFACTFVVLLAGKVFERAYSGRTWMRRVLVLGAAERAMLVDLLRRVRDRLGIVVIGFVDLQDRPRRITGSSIIEVKTPLPVFVEQNRIDELVLAFDDRRGNSSIPAQEILQCKANGVSVIDVCTFYERQIGKVHLGSTSMDSVALSDVYSTPLQRSARKRLLDVVLASVVLFVAWPAMVAIAGAILIESRGKGPVFYRQERAGKNGRPFKLLKFRSMEVDAEGDGVARWAQIEDERVTRVGAFMRKTRLDELPQLWNVLKGEMSLVGPRPERPEMVRELAQSIPNYPLRLLVKPGITGWAQVRYPYGASVKDAEEKLSYDLYYIKHYSLGFDLAVIIQTPQVMLWGKGA
ncbi:MAG: TIGR03013 family XrtA/PEP-CTERM system glycosyltransferase, partial [Gammaproteobacteria bacterium]